MIVRDEAPDDRDVIGEIHRRAFGQDAEAKLVSELRDERHSRVSLVAELDGVIVGHVLFSELVIETLTAKVPALALAPLAVLPEFQRQGIGSILVHEGLEAAFDEGHKMVVVVGDVGFYSRFGFSSALAEPLESEYSGPNLMTIELLPGSLKGVRGRLRYPAPFARL